MSRLDRFLILEEWLNTWSNLLQWGLKRCLSDYCVVVLKEKELNWGPKLFRMMKCWEDMGGYAMFVKNKWKSLEVGGWKGFVLKEKLKGIKAKLKMWNKEHFGNLDSQITEAKEELNNIDLKGEAGILSKEEVNKRILCLSRIHTLSSRKCCFLWQRSRMRWLKEGDANSNFFHRCIKKRRKINEILGLNFDGSLVEGVEPLKNEIRGHFERHFKSGGGV